MGENGSRQVTTGTPLGGQLGTIQLRRHANGPWLTIPVTVLDKRGIFGRQELLVTPVNGSGECWLDATALTPEHPEGTETTAPDNSALERKDTP